MNDYARESTLRSLNSNVETLDNHIQALNNNIISYCEGFNLLLITVAIILSVKFIESFIDTLLHGRK